jgi:hypothetical protein
MPTARRANLPSDKTFLAVGLFARLADAIDRGKLVEASRTRARLSALGFVVSFRSRRPAPAGRKGVAP